MNATRSCVTSQRWWRPSTSPSPCPTSPTSTARALARNGEEIDHLGGARYDHDVTTAGAPRFSLVALDCPDPIALATFYSALSGLEVEPLQGFPEDQVTWLELLHEGRPTIAFQKVANYVAPTWPEGAVPQQLHLDFDVDDLDAGEAFVLSIGATKATVQPGTSFRVYFDPVGHPFCLVRRS
ncbi:MAG: hypothetical protein KGJ10_06845 [Acidobacteriota bacterium]|nr:hypothetical protein [Acidobacteriota bacterium]MDE3107187.1 hypothetical protein [Acidobacteriota bacterium]